MPKASASSLIPPSSPAKVVSLHCTCATLRRATRVVTSFYDQELRHLGLRTTQYTILQVLAGVGEAAQGSLGEILGADSTTLSRNLRRMEEEGWITSRPGRDRRQRLWSLSERGEEMLQRAQPLWRRAQEQAQERLDAALGDGTWRQLHQLLDRATLAFGEV